MLFNSFTFLVFFAVVFILYFLTPKKVRWLVLLGASIYFYASWNLTYVILIGCAIAASYSSARLIELTEKKWQRRLLLIFTMLICFNLLVMFKYYNFFGSLVNTVWRRADGAPGLPLISVLLPVGVSFYTFQSVSYVIDVYRGRLKAERNPLYYILFVMFFPQLVAGPIERAGDLLPQLRSPRKFEYRRAVEGFHIILWGLFKKCVIADSLCIAADHVYGNIALQSSYGVIIGTVFFAFQIYCDFSGYSDIAVGLGKILGYELTLNFKNPYLSKNIEEFWAKWHITLSQWFRDYLYIPLGGNRRGTFRTLVNLFITFLVSGLWHGANVTFVIWGAFHGLLLILYKLIKKPLEAASKHVQNKLLVFVGNTAARIVTFALVCFGWIFFRANSLDDAKAIILKICNFGGAAFADSFASLGINPDMLKFICVLTVLMLVFEYFRFKYDLFERFARTSVLVQMPVCLVLSAVIMLVLVYFGGGEVKPFVYFQF